jgi:uridylate kinase
MPCFAVERGIIMEPVYKRLLLKVSGEVLAGDAGHGFDFNVINDVCLNIKKVTDKGVQVGIVVGGGNFWRGRQGKNMNRTRADHMGMLATVINSLALQDELESVGVKSKVLSGIEMRTVAEQFTARDADKYLSEGQVVIFGGGIGAPFFTTDTAAALRASEIEADALLLAKNVGYIYSADPKKDPTATPYDEITFSEMINKKLTVIDYTATTFCMDKGIPVLLFGMDDPYNIIKAIKGEHIGTIIKED